MCMCGDERLCVKYESADSRQDERRKLWPVSRERERERIACVSYYTRIGRIFSPSTQSYEGKLCGNIISVDFFLIDPIVASSFPTLVQSRPWLIF